MSRLENLSAIDFEALCRDLAKEEIGQRFSAFGPGADGGVDGRYLVGGGTTILQCKHYIGSSFAALKAAAKKEIKKIKNLAPRRYLFFTSQPLTPNRSDMLAEIFGDYLVQPGDIWGKEDIESALNRYPEIEKSLMKLWLSSAAVLERILQSGLESFTQATKFEILEELRVYVRNPSFDEAMEKLKNEKILVVSGPPGVGKTTLAKMVAYNYLNEGWRFYAVNSLEDCFAKIDDGQPTIFFFDDFLGRIELDRQSLQRDTALSVFVNRVRRSKNARFILTTRAHIFEEARRLSDHVDDKRFQLAKYLLDVGVYTRKIKAHILFNHLSISVFSKAHFSALIGGDWLQKIVDHKNYNPRIIASVSSGCIDTVDPEGYPKHVYHALEKPDLIWSKPFKNLNIMSQNLLITLFFGREYGENIEVLRKDYLGVHRAICVFHSQPTKPNDFYESLHSLETGFLSIADQKVSFVNPSVRDFLKSYLTDKYFLSLLPEAAVRINWARHLWLHIKNVFNTRERDMKHFADLFMKFSSTIEFTASLIFFDRDNCCSYWVDELSLSGRVELLLEWWHHTSEEFFINRALEILRSSSLKFEARQDGGSLPELHGWVGIFVDSDDHAKTSLLLAIEDRIMEVLDEGMPSEDLLSTVKAVDEFMSLTAPGNLTEALDRVVSYELSNTDDAISHLDTEIELSEYLDFLEYLGKATEHDTEQAKEVLLGRMNDLEEQDHSELESSFNPADEQGQEKFGDNELKSLFSTLLN